MTKIPVSEITDLEGNIDGARLVEALTRGGLTIYGMDMTTIYQLRLDYLDRHGHFPPGPDLRVSTNCPHCSRPVSRNLVEWCGEIPCPM